MNTSDNKGPTSLINAQHGKPTSIASRNLLEGIYNGTIGASPELSKILDENSPSLDQFLAFGKNSVSIDESDIEEGYTRPKYVGKIHKLLEDTGFCGFRLNGNMLVPIYSSIVTCPYFYFDEGELIGDDQKLLEAIGENDNNGEVFFIRTKTGDFKKCNLEKRA